ncbi:MAG: quinolinate synthase NadA [Thermoproteota archaeon]|nr:quinolinate synthase NadA [Thermoproteota archaeon]
MTEINRKLIDNILKLKKRKKAVILAHNYQRGEIQDIADYVGDSIGLSKKAKEVQDAKLIVFSAVDFMAESAAIINPDKKVLLPSMGARCPMAQMLPAEEVKYWKAKHPGAPVVLYVNTSAEAKAECTVCCTSANAVEVVNSLDADTVLFGPDANLAWHVQQNTEKKIIPIPEKGFCPVHVLFLKEDALLLKKKNVDAVISVHPECPPDVQSMADFVGSTSQMCRYAKKMSAEKSIIGTEIGLLHRLKKENPEKMFIPLYEDAVCVNMKLNTLERIYQSLNREQYLVKVPKPVAEKARNALERMFSVTG